MRKEPTPQDAALNYFYGDEAEQFSYFRIPRLLITSPRFKGLSIEAKLLYGLMLDRMGLSCKNGWCEDDGRVFIHYTLEEICDDLNCGHEKAVKLVAELDGGKGLGLIERKRQGQGKPTKIYVKRFTLSTTPAQTSENRISRLPKIGSQDFGKSEVKTSEKQNSRLPKTGSPDFRKSECSYNNINYTESIYPESVNPSTLPSMENLVRTREGAGDGLTDGRGVRERIKKQIEYDLLPYRDHTTWQLRQADELVELMVEVALTQSPSIQIGQGSYPADYVKERFAKIRCEHIEQVLTGLSENEGRVTNVRAYMLASLFNATASLESVYGLSTSYG